MASAGKKKKGDKTPKKHRELPSALKANIWKPGVSPNPTGRPKGSRNKLGEAFLAELHKDFEEYGAFAIADCRKEDPSRYCAIIASIIPKDLSNNDEERLLEKFLEQFTTVEEIRDFRKQLGYLSSGQSTSEEGSPPIPRR